MLQQMDTNTEKPATVSLRYVFAQSSKSDVFQVEALLGELVTIEGCMCAPDKLWVSLKLQASPQSGQSYLGSADKVCRIGAGVIHVIVPLK